MKEYILETERLRLRKLREEDAEYLFALQNTSEDKSELENAFTSIEETKKFIRCYDQYNYNLGRWAVERKADEQFLGWSGLKFNLGSGDVDLDFRYNETFWGQGYASEAAYACLFYAFESQGLFDVISRADKNDDCFVRILEKLGMSCQKDTNDDKAAQTVYKCQSFAFKRKADLAVSVL